MSGDVCHAVVVWRATTANHAHRFPEIALACRILEAAGVSLECEDQAASG